MKCIRYLASILILIVMLCTACAPVVPTKDPLVPEPSSAFYVLDSSNVLEASTESKIIEISAALADKTGAQVVVVTMDTLAGRKLEEVSLNLFNSWGIGDAQKNNGVLIFLAKEDRKVRIEVGTGLEARLTSAVAGSILDDYALPYFKANKYEEGILNSYLAVVMELAYEYGLDPTTLGATQPTSG